MEKLPFANVINVFLFVLGAKYYVPIKLVTTTGHLHKIKQKGVLLSKNIGLTQH